MKPKEIVIGNLYRNSAYPTSLYKGIVAPNGQLTFKIVQSDEMLGKYVVYDEEIELCMDFWNKFTPAETDAIEPTAPIEGAEPVQKARFNKEALKLPEGEFSTKEVAAFNNVEYVTASQFINAELEAGTLKKTRTERRAARGKETQLFSRVS